MVFSGKFRVLTLLAVLAISASGCTSRTYNSAPNADIGVPVGLSARFGEDPTRPGITKFEITGSDSSGKQTTFVTRYAIGTTGFSEIQFIKDPDVGPEGLAKPALEQTPQNLFGTVLTPIQDENFGYVTNSPWTCEDAEILAYGSSRTSGATGAKQLCLIELHTMGKKDAVSIIIIGLDSKANGDGTLDKDVVRKSIAEKLRKDPAWGAAKVAVGVGVRNRAISAGPPERPNEGMDVAGVVEGLIEVQKKFGSLVDERTRNTCLRNYLTVVAKWTDAADHYWCQFPVKKLDGEADDKIGARACYVSKVLELKSADDAAGLGISRKDIPKLAAAIGLRQYHEAAFNHCLAKGEGPFVWINENAKRRDTFKYLMQAVQGAMDFNVESEQKAINEFYQRIGKTRSRRVNDTYPEWLPEQPRYAEIIKTQAKARLAFVLLEKQYLNWLKTNPVGPGIPGRFGGSGQ